MLEVQMEETIIQFISSCDDILIFGKEVPFLSRCIDIVLQNKKNELISIELKIKDWKHAIKQALNHKLGADYSYICIPKRKLSPILEKSILEAQIGLMMFDETVLTPLTIVIEAPKNQNQIIFKQLLLKNFIKCQI